MSCMEDLVSRGIVHQCSDSQAVGAALDAGLLKPYQGFDATAPSLHVGSLAGLITLRRMQLKGNRPIILIGGATSLIGDPSGKRTERPLLSREEVRFNSEGIKSQMARIVDFAGDNPAIMVDNAEWFAQMNLLDFLREVGKHCPVNAMLSKDAVKNRLGSESGLSFAEFSYPLFQAYDFLHLFRTYGCTMQLGGSDQWGNMTAGIDLIRRTTGTQAFAVTIPLVTTASGEKMGKTADGAVWLDPEKTSPYAFYQFWINTDDRDVERFLKYYTFLSLPTIEQLCRDDIRVAKESLAFEVTMLVHGEDAATAARATSRTAFSGCANDASGLPSVTIPRTSLSSGMLVVDLLVFCGLAESKAQARRLIEQGGASIDTRRIADVSERIDVDAMNAGVAILKVGKRRLLRVIASGS